MSIYYNGTDFVQPMTKGYYVPASDNIGLIVVLAFVTLFMVLMFFEAYNTRRLLDRYRLKYSFDRELESKDVDGSERKLNLREKRFKSRVYKD